MQRPIASGTRLGSHLIEDLLGEGGMGEVYRARDPRLNGWGANGTSNADHTKFVVVDAPHGSGQTFRVLTYWRP